MLVDIQGENKKDMKSEAKRMIKLDLFLFFSIVFSGHICKETNTLIIGAWSFLLLIQIRFTPSDITLFYP